MTTPADTDWSAAIAVARELIADLYAEAPLANVARCLLAAAEERERLEAIIESHVTIPFGRIRADERAATLRDVAKMLRENAKAHQLQEGRNMKRYAEMFDRMADETSNTSGPLRRERVTAETECERLRLELENERQKFDEQNKAAAAELRMLRVQLTQRDKVSTRYDVRHHCGCVVGPRLTCVEHCGGHAVPEDEHMTFPVSPSATAAVEEFALLVVAHITSDEGYEELRMDPDADPPWLFARIIRRLAKAFTLKDT